MTSLAELLWPEERRVARPPERLSVSEWADRHRVLDPINCSRPGPWETDFAPYLRGIMDAYSDPRVREIVLMGSTQWGKTETAINCLLHTIDQDPVPTLFVLPTEEDVLSFAERRLKAAIEASARTAGRMTGRKADWKKNELGFDGMVLYLGWSNSPSRLASRSIGRLFMDEADKFPAFSGREADPISLATERLRWYSDSKRVVSSTPTTTQGPIWRLWQGSDQRWFHVPCPECGAFQSLRFARETVVFGDERDPEKIREERLARYVCRRCSAEIEDDDDHKRRMLLRGVWCPEGGHVSKRGAIEGVRADAPVRGFHVNALYSPVLSWSDVAAMFLESKDDVASLMNFTNSWLGWPWVEKATETSIEEIRGRSISALPRSTVPARAVVLTAGVDVQKTVIYYSVRAHSYGERSVTIEAGIVERFEQLAAVLFETAWPIHERSDETMRLRLACVDSGYRTDEVYAFCAEFPDLARPCKGHQHRTTPIAPTKIERDWLGRPGGLQLWNVDSSFYKDKLTRRIHATVGAVGSWNVHAEPSDDFCAQLTAEHRVLVRKRSSKQVTEEWAKRPGRSANHWWDCEVLNEAAADMLGVYALRDQATEAASARVASSPSDADRMGERTAPQAPATRFGRARRGFIRKRGR